MARSTNRKNRWLRSQDLDLRVDASHFHRMNDRFIRSVQSERRPFSSTTLLSDRTAMRSNVVLTLPSLSRTSDAQLWGRVQGSNPAKFPPIARECVRSVGEFMVSLPFARLRNEVRKSLKSLARPTGFEPVTSAFGGQRPRGRRSRIHCRAATLP